jgi:hypothetical protein
MNRKLLPILSTQSAANVRHTTTENMIYFWDTVRSDTFEIMVSTRLALTIPYYWVSFSRWTQTNTNQSSQFANEHVLGDKKVAPFAKCGVSFLFKPDSDIDVPF